MRSMLSVLTYSLLVVAHFTVTQAQELFQEHLTLRPHRDGTVLAHFAFTTLLKGAEPSIPEVTEVEDGCTHLHACTMCI
jgi:GPI-anchor transamidase subunit T